MMLKCKLCRIHSAPLLQQMSVLRASLLINLLCSSICTHSAAQFVYVYDSPESCSTNGFGNSDASACESMAASIGQPFMGSAVLDGTEGGCVNWLSSDGTSTGWWFSDPAAVSTPGPCSGGVIRNGEIVSGWVCLCTCTPEQALEGVCEYSPRNLLGSSQGSSSTMWNTFNMFFYSKAFWGWFCNNDEKMIGMNLC